MSSHGDLGEGDTPLDRALEQAGAVEPDPPLGFVAGVMRRVHDAQIRMSLWRQWRRSVRATNLLTRAGVDPASIGIVADNRRSAATGVIIMKKIVWGAAAVGALAVVSVVWLGYPPMGPGTEGTVGGAQRYQATPAGDKSAELGDMTVQAFLQTDTFDRLIKNPDSRAVLQKAATDPEFQHALANPALGRALADPAVARALANPAVSRALADPAVSRALADPAVSRA